MLCLFDKEVEVIKNHYFHNNIPYSFQQKYLLHNIFVVKYIKAV